VDVREELLTIAEIAVGLAGFAGVVAAFMHRVDTPRADRIRFVNLFAAAFATIVLAYTPLVFLHLGVRGEDVWVRSSVVMLLAWFINSAIGSRVTRIFDEVDFGGLDGSANRVWIARSIIIGPALVNLVVQLLNVGGWWWSPSFVAYLFGLFVYVYSTMVMFVYMVLFRPRT